MEKAVTYTYQTLNPFIDQEKDNNDHDFEKIGKNWFNEQINIRKLLYWNVLK